MLLQVDYIFVINLSAPRRRNVLINKKRSATMCCGTFS